MIVIRNNHCSIMKIHEVLDVLDKRIKNFVVNSLECDEEKTTSSSEISQIQQNFNSLKQQVSDLNSKVVQNDPIWSKKDDYDTQHSILKTNKLIENNKREIKKIKTDIKCVK